MIVNDNKDLDTYIDAGEIATELDTNGEVVSLYMHQDVVFTTTNASTITIPE